MWKDTEEIDKQRDWGAGTETPSGIQNQYEVSGGIET